MYKTSNCKQMGTCPQVLYHLISPYRTEEPGHRLQLCAHNYVNMSLMINKSEEEERKGREGERDGGGGREKRRERKEGREREGRSCVI